MLSVMPCFSAGKEVIGIDEANAPFMYEDPATGKAAGLYPLLIAEAFSLAGIDVEFRPLPWRRALSYGEQGIMGIGGIYKTKSARQYSITPNPSIRRR